MSLCVGGIVTILVGVVVAMLLGLCKVEINQSFEIENVKMSSNIRL